MSDTPRTDARVRRMIDNDIAPDALESFAKELERELNAANARIAYLEAHVARLEEALDCVMPTCNHLHHDKRHQHKASETCPVELLIRRAKEAKP